MNAGEFTADMVTASNMLNALDSEGLSNGRITDICLAVITAVNARRSAREAKEEGL